MNNTNHLNESVRFRISQHTTPHHWLMRKRKRECVLVCGLVLPFHLEEERQSHVFDFQCLLVSWLCGAAADSRPILLAFDYKQRTVNIFKHFNFEWNYCDCTTSHYQIFSLMITWRSCSQNNESRELKKLPKRRRRRINRKWISREETVWENFVEFCDWMLKQWQKFCDNFWGATTTFLNIKSTHHKVVFNFINANQFFRSCNW